MSRKAIDLRGKRFGKLLVLERASRPLYSTDLHAHWKCLCDCGQYSTPSSASLRAGTKCCYECKFSRRVPVLQQLIERYKKNACQRKYEFSLSEELFYQLIISLCDYCGSPPETVFRSGKVISVRDPFKYNGIDRIDSAKGYVEGNVVACCKSCNELKSDKSREEFLRLVAAIYHHRIGREATA